MPLLFAVAGAADRWNPPSAPRAVAPYVRREKASVDAHDRDRQAAERLPECAGERRPRFGVARVAERRAEVEHGDFAVAGGEAEHDVNEPIVLYVDAGGNLFDLAVDRRAALVVQALDIGRAVAGRQSEHGIPENHHAERVAAVDGSLGPAPLTYALAERRPGRVEPRQGERDHVVVGRLVALCEPSAAP